MRVIHLKVERFRGIHLLEWYPESRIACLIGPGDSTKTTILDALEFAISPRWSVQVTDTDFHGGKVTEPLVITVTVGDLPPSLMTEEKYGLYLRGWDVDHGLRDEPEGEDEPVLTIRFSVDDSLEPTWVVVNDRLPEGRNIPARDREMLGLARLGGEIDRHLAWGRGSALSRHTGSLDEVGRVLAAAHREARDMVRRGSMTKLEEAAKNAREAAIQMGVRSVGAYRPALDALLGTTGSGSLSLHEGEIPVRAVGLGSRRLVALAIQAMALKEGAILLVDEVEQALEPHRLRHLLRALSRGADGSRGQVFMTTHSGVPIEELSAHYLYVVRSDGGATTIRHVRPDLQDLVRKTPEAFLGRKVLVCEGKTELGICRALEGYWSSSHQSVPVAHTGTVLIHGGGSEAPKIAERLAALEYKTALLADSDQPLDPDPAALAQAGVSVILWAGNVSTEERIALDLPWASLQEILNLALEICGEQSVFDVIRSQVPTGTILRGVTIEEWRGEGVGEDTIRRALGQAAKKAKWFKRIDLGEELGLIVGRAIPSIGPSDLGLKLSTLADWVYAD